MSPLRKSVRFASALLLCAAFFACVRFFWTHFTAGLEFDGADGRAVECVVESCGGRVVDSAAVAGGRVSFRIPIDAERFHYALRPQGGAYRLKTLTLCGFPLFPARWLVGNVAPRVWLYSPGAPLADGALSLHVAPGENELDYRRLFEMLPRLFRFVRLGVASLPLVLLLAFVLLRTAVRNAARLDRPAVFCAVAIAIALGLLPDPVRPAMPGLDPSWQWLVNQAAWTGAFGGEVVFTYGPLGFLLFPQTPMANVFTALAVNSLFALAWCALLLQTYRAENGRPCAWLLALSMLFIQSNNEWRWVVLGILCVALPMVWEGVSRRRDALAMSVGGAVLAVASLTKFSSLVAILATQAFFAAGYVRKNGRRGLAPCAAWFVSASVAFALLCAACFPSFAAFVGWVRGSLATANGYNLCMTAEKSWAELLLPFAVLLSLLAAVALRRGFSARDLVLPFLFSPFLFCATKYALVRQTPLPLMYGSIALLALATARRRALARRAAVLSCAFIVAGFGLTVPWMASGLWDGDFRLGLNPAGALKSASLGRLAERAADETDRAVRERADVPSAWREKIGKGSVLFVPYEMASAMASDTKFLTVWLPSVQLYSACHPYLDELDAALLEGERAPEWIVCGLDAAWSGHLLNYPQFWSAVLRRYEFSDGDSKFALLRRRMAPLSPAPRASAARTLRAGPGEWLDCSSLAGADVSVDWPRTAFGRFCAMFLRAASAYVVVRYDDGVEARIRLLSENAAAASFPLGMVVSDDADLLAALKGAPRHRPAALRFEASSPSHFAPEAIVRSRAD